MKRVRSPCRQDPGPAAPSPFPSIRFQGMQFPSKTASKNFPGLSKSCKKFPRIMTFQWVTQANGRESNCQAVRPARDPEPWRARVPDRQNAALAAMDVRVRGHDNVGSCEKKTSRPPSAGSSAATRHPRPTRLRRRERLLRSRTHGTLQKSFDFPLVLISLAHSENTVKQMSENQNFRVLPGESLRRLRPRDVARPRSAAGQGSTAA